MVRARTGTAQRIRFRKRRANSSATFCDQNSAVRGALFSASVDTIFEALNILSAIKMTTFASGKGDKKEFLSYAPGYWPEAAPELWNDWKWQLKNRVTSLAQLEKHLDLGDEERSGVLLSG